MITWMTRRSMGLTAADLDTPRLALQLKQTKLILDKMGGLEVEDIPDNHPVLRMWEGYDIALCIYGMMMSAEWHMNRGYADKSCFEFFDICQEIKAALREEDQPTAFVSPPWFQDVDVLRSHRSNLLRRKHKFYSDVWTKIDEGWPYIWPFIDEDEEDGYKLMLSKSDKDRLARKERTLPKDVLRRIANA